jgi:TPR repeat protein
MPGRRQPAADFNRALRCAADADAFAYLLRAAEDGCIRSQFLVGLAYHTGRGVGVDYNQAAAWYRKAACAADGPAIANLGLMCMLGQGGPADDLEAYGWVRSAVGTGHEWLRPALDLLEQRIAGRTPEDAARTLASLSPEIPAVGPCTLPACDPSLCQVL